jgi:hypothetical protein
MFGLDYCIQFSALLMKASLKNKKKGSAFEANNLDIVEDSERRETFEALIPAYFPFSGVNLLYGVLGKRQCLFFASQ